MKVEIIITVLSIVIALLAGGYITKLRKEVKEFRHALFDLVNFSIVAFSDRNLSEEEKNKMLELFDKAKKEYRDVAELAKEVAQVFVTRGNRG